MATFNFALDGKVDMMSINPLEMTNFEMAGTLFGVAGVLIALALNHYAKNRKRQLPHVFTAQETEQDAIE
ncbi:hypothetical protein ACFQ1E_19975 [Sphingomonas canadensis]|uniref:Uncharacterized protein n=1 Tax=Sphingomonas canadensis TaxID=1219257 RepID=A0ABW3HB00_9SPHN|nr:hypothetical protein [Sphingomonas canadensis]MCW3838328.1 hypothetical protein [Sphingomonas canadensis]